MSVISELLHLNIHWEGKSHDRKEREIKFKFVEEKIHVILGPRRAGKTHFVKFLINELINYVSPWNILYVDFFHPFMIPYSSPKKFIELINSYLKERNIEHKDFYLFIDEVQELDEWHKVCEYYRNKGVKVVITGSNASLISEDIGYLLVGRHIDYEIFPLSLREYIKWKNINLKVENPLDVVEKYTFSSFPEYVIYENKEVLSQIFSDIVYRDLFWRHNVRDRDKMMNLIGYLLENIGRYVSYNSISRAIGISEKTAAEFLGYLQNTYLFFLLKRYSMKTQDIIKSPRKVYIIDNSFSILKRVKSLEDKGRYMENLVFIELKRRKKEFYYYLTKEGYEVDFLIKEGMQIKELIQVSYNVYDEDTFKREIRALLHAKEDLNLGDDVPLTIITWDYEDEKEIEWWRKKGRIRFVPLWKWLLRL